MFSGRKVLFERLLALVVQKEFIDKAARFAMDRSDLQQKKPRRGAGLGMSDISFDAAVPSGSMQ